MILDLLCLQNSLLEVSHCILLEIKQDLASASMLLYYFFLSSMQLTKPKFSLLLTYLTIDMISKFLLCFCIILHKLKIIQRVQSLRLSKSNSLYGLHWISSDALSSSLYSLSAHTSRAKTKHDTTFLLKYSDSGCIIFRCVFPRIRASYDLK